MFWSPLCSQAASLCVESRPILVSPLVVRGQASAPDRYREKYTNIANDDLSEEMYIYTIFCLTRKNVSFLLSTLSDLF